MAKMSPTNIEAPPIHMTDEMSEIVVFMPLFASSFLRIL